MNTVKTSGQLSIPVNWYKTILKPETKKGKIESKSHVLAITILSDIVNKPLNSENELRYSYSHIEETFMCSKEDARSCISFLEGLGLIKRVFKTMQIESVTVSNVMFLQLSHSVLEKATNGKTPLKEVI